jgi:hypothetical protein
MRSEKVRTLKTDDNSAMLSAGKSKYLFIILPALLFALFIFQLVYHAVRTSAIVDEPAHILAGHRHWQCGDFGINPEHPPMLKLLATAPIEFHALKDPPYECGSRVTSKSDLFLYGTKFLVQNGVDWLVIPARLSAALISVALAILVFASVWKMFGRWEALTALALFAFEPNLIANGALVTTDMAITATAFAAVIALYSFCRAPGWLRFFVAGGAFGLLLSAKHSAVIFVPGLFAVMIADALIFRRNEKSFGKLALKQTAAFAGICLLGLIVLWSFYGFRYRAIPNTSAETVSVADYIRANGRPEIVDSLSAKVVTAIGRTHVFPESYTLGLADVVAWGNRNMFLFDRAYPTGRWFYFPVSFLVKSSIALLLLLPIGFAFPLFARERRREMMFLLVPPIIFFTIALTSGTNIGVRHILPVYPFFIVAGAVGAVWLGRKWRVFRYILAALLLFHALTAVRTAPDYIPFANDFWGGPDNTYKIYRDPNLDFGQNNKFVREYLERENIRDCWFAPQGNFELVADTQPCRLLPGSFGLSVSDQPNEPVPPVIEGTVLVTAMVFPPRGGAEYLPIMQAEPIARLGRGIFVYRGRFEIPGVAALSHTERAYLFLRQNRFEEALTDASRAVELFPDDARPHIAFGLALLRTGQTAAARRELERANETLKSNPVLLRASEIRAHQELKRLE